MKIFLSYAHSTLPRVQQLAEFLRLGGHDVWFDQRLVGGQPWKEQLRAQIKTSQCFIYALTPESVGSAWCQWEFAQAVHMGKKIVTVLLARCDLDGALGDHQYIDFTRGDSLETGLRLGTAVFAAEPIPPELVPLLPDPDSDVSPEREIEHFVSEDNALTQRLYDEAYQVYRAKNYEEARELLQDLLHIEPQYNEACELLAVVERRLALGRTPFPAVTETPFPIVTKTPPAVVTETTPPAVTETPPAVVTEILPPTITESSPPVLLLPPPFEWVEISAGKVKLITDKMDKKNSYLKGDTVFDVPAFMFAKYPITNAQYEKFVEAGGYGEKKWWTTDGWVACQNENWTEPRYWRDTKWNGADFPVVGVSWYEAVAFCRWLSEVSGEPVLLPTEEQWQRAAQGDDWWEYPWGKTFDPNKCNTSESGIKQTTPVTQYPEGASPYGVMDMSGNVWEWCLTAYETGSTDLNGTARRVLRGGSWYYGRYSARAVYRLDSHPNFGDDNYGFRVVCASPR